MKRTLSIFLILVTLMTSLSGCRELLEQWEADLRGETSPTQAPTEAPTQAPTEPPAPATNVAKPLSKAALEALPVAKAGMSEDELREIVVEYMLMQCSFAWTPSEKLTFNPISTKFMALNPGEVYGGSPYVGSRFGTLYNMMHFYDDRNGMLDVAALKNLKVDWQYVIGNMCSSSTIWAWRRVSNSISCNSTYTLIPNRGVIPVGDYDVSALAPYNALENSGINTQDICTSNGQETMYEAYAQLKKADGILYLDEPKRSGHVIMVTSVNVIRDANGKVDGSKSTITFIDQTYTFKDYTQENGVTIKTFGNVHTTYTFSRMFSIGCLPFTIPEFVGKSPVEDGTVSLQHNGDSITVDQLGARNVVANYPISYTTITIKDPSGNVLYSGHSYVTGPVSRPETFTALAASSDFIDPMELEAFANGENTVEVTARIGTGEVLTAFTGILAAK